MTINKGTARHGEGHQHMSKVQQRVAVEPHDLGLDVMTELRIEQFRMHGKGKADQKRVQDESQGRTETLHVQKHVGSVHVFPLLSSFYK
jgi:hypothetical protein